MEERIAVLIACCQPYHVARLSALSAGAPGGVQVLEVSRKQVQSPWEADLSTTSLDVRSLFDVPYETIDRGELVRRLTSALHAADPTVLVASGYSTLESRHMARWGRRRGRPVVTFFESTLEDRRRWWPKEWSKRRLVRGLFDGAFAGGVRHAAYAQSLGIPASRVVTGYDVVDNEYFARRAEQARSAPVGARQRVGVPEAYFLYVGRMAPEKNVPFLLRSYAAYRQATDEPWDLVMVGTGPAEHKCKRLTQELGIAGLHWMGPKLLGELPRYYALASCFVLASISEPWGLVVNEAMAAGLPVIVSERCGCVPELVRDGVNGFVFDPWDGAALTHTMVRVSSDECNVAEMGRASQQIISDYTPDTWAAQLLELIRFVRRGEGASL